MSKETQLQALANQVRDFINGEIPTVATWNVNPGVERTSLNLLGSFFTDTDGQVAALLAKFNADHDPVTGKNPIPNEWVAEPATPTFQSAAAFTLAGDRRTDYVKGHRVRLTLGPNLVIVGLDDVTYDPGTNRTTGVCNPAVVNNTLTKVERSLVRFSVPRVQASDLMAAAVTTAALADGSITSAKLGTQQVLTQHLGLAQVTAAQLAAASVGTSQLQTAAVTAAKIANLAVGTLQIAFGAITATKLAPAAVTESVIEDTAVSNRTLAVGAVTQDKMAAGLLPNLATSNLLRNGSFESFSAGTTAAPDAWALTGAAAAASRRTDEQAFGTACVRLTAGTAASALTQTIPIGVAVNPALRGQLVTLMCFVKSSVVNAGRLTLDDGIAVAWSPTHPGNGAFTLLSVTLLINNNATQIVAKLENLKTDSATFVSFDGAMLVFGEVAPSLFTPHPNDEMLRAQHYQNNAQNQVLGNVVAQHGWGFLLVPDATTKALLAPIVFPVPFRTLLRITPAFVGRKSGSDPTSWTDIDALPATGRDGVATPSLQGGVGARPTVNGFTLALTPISGDNFPTLGGPYRYVYQWEAWGVLP